MQTEKNSDFFCYLEFNQLWLSRPQRWRSDQSKRFSFSALFFFSVVTSFAFWFKNRSRLTAKPDNEPHTAKGYVYVKRLFLFSFYLALSFGFLIFHPICGLIQKCLSAMSMGCVRLGISYLLHVSLYRRLYLRDRSITFWKHSVESFVGFDVFILFIYFGTWFFLFLSS